MNASSSRSKLETKEHQNQQSERQKTHMEVSSDFSQQVVGASMRDIPKLAMRSVSLIPAHRRRRPLEMLGMDYCLKKSVRQATSARLG